jgi:PPOX class probable F420-dependent enzyme
MDKTASPAFPHLRGHSFMCLTSFRKSGEAVPTTVWFAQQDDKLYVMTLAAAGKVTRIRHNAMVEVAPCTGRGEILGDAAEAMARVLPASEEQTARRALNQKYGVQMFFFALYIKLRRRQMVYLEISPM